MLSEEKRKELLAKRKYFNEHPEEAEKEYVKRKDDYVPLGMPPKKEKKDE